MDKIFYKTSVLFIFLLLALGYYSSLKNGLSIDENFHHINGEVRYHYLINFGNFEKYDFNDNRFYPGLIDTISFIFFKILSSIINLKYLVEIKHTINFLYSLLGLCGLYLVNKKIFNKEIAIISCLLTLLNPFFFGHMGINPKDTVLFTFLIWTIYYLIEYLEKINVNRLKHLILLSIMIGLGSNTRITFLSLLFPLILFGLYYVWINTKSIKIIFIDLFTISIITFLLIIIIWPHFHNGDYSLIIENIKQSSKWLISVKHGLINGNFYEIQNTPRSYVFQIFLYRTPIFIIFLFLLTYIVILNKKEYLKDQIGNNFNFKFLLLNIIFYWPILILIITKINLYDNFRLILFLIPFLSTISSIGLWYLIKNYNEIKVYYKSVLFLILILNVLFLARFISITPYNYVYVNYFSSPVFSNSQNKYEHDYWLTSVGELTKKIRSKYGNKTSEMKIALCGGRALTHGYYFATILKNFNIYNFEEADFVIVSNRNLQYDKKTCIQKFSGDDLVSVKKNGLLLSSFRKIKK